MSGQQDSARVIEVTCPKCKSKEKFITYNSVNITEENGLKEKVMDGSLFLFNCPKCDAKVNIEYPFLYHNVEDHVMFHYCISDENVKSVVDLLTHPDTNEHKSMVATLSKNNYIIRIVRSKADLLEKINIYDEGLDDRFVEIAKTIVASRFSQENKDKKITGLRFIKTADEGRLVQIYVDKKVYAYANLTDELYQSVVYDFSSRVKPLREDKNLLVNQFWSTNIVKQKSIEESEK